MRATLTRPIAARAPSGWQEHKSKPLSTRIDSEPGEPENPAAPNGGAGTYPTPETEPIG
jgi:hypothetical protein